MKKLLKTVMFGKGEDVVETEDEDAQSTFCGDEVPEDESRDDSEDADV